MKKVCMIGTGYVGLVTGTCFAELGHNVICVDKDEKKIEDLKRGHIPIYEPGLDKLVKKHRANGRLTFTTKIADGVKASELIFIAVNTPPLPDGGADLSFVEACTREVARWANGYKLLVEKSTVPVQTGDRIKKTLAGLGAAAQQIEVASNPEFLREGSAIEDFLKPDRIVFGVSSKRAEKHLRELYGKIKAPVVVTDINSAELIKHASNSFLALKISYINAIAQLCEKVGADVSKVAEGMGFDARIGKSFLSAGIGYGGSCFPKDVSAFIKIAEKNGYNFDLLKATEHINNIQRKIVVKKLEEALWTLKGKTIAVWGLAFKPNTDDLRNAPAKDIIEDLLAGGAHVRAYDPVAMEKMKSIFPSIHYTTSALDAVKGSDALLIVTEWDEFKKVNLSKVKKLLKSPLVVDGRNMFSLEAMARLEFIYHSIGRASVPVHHHAAPVSAAV
jgi:UDPglucose 6-dehydrogenase